MPLILALDQGTTSSRSIVFDDTGTIRGVAQKEFAQRFPKPGWVEHDPEEIWSTQRDTIEAALTRAGAKASDLAAIGIANQRETTVVWDRSTGAPIHAAIVWQDRRTAAQCDELRRAGKDVLIAERTGLVLDPYFSGTKVRWILDNVAGARRRAERGELAFGTIDAWLLHKLTDGRVHATDPSNASRTLLFDIRRGDWDDDLSALLGVPRSMLPRIVPTSGIVAETGGASLAAGIPIAGIVGDQQGALAGQACFAAGSAKCTYGTGCFLLLNTGGSPQVSRHRLLTTVAWRLGGDGAATTYAIEGSVFIGGAVVQWLRDGLRIIHESVEVEKLAATVADSGDVYLVPAFAGLGAPQWDAAARGLIVGITRGTTAAHVARAAIEAIAFQVNDLLEAMRKDAATELEELRVDGGAAANDGLLQFQADLLRMPVVRPKVLETTAWGAACMAGLAVGVWKSPDELARRWTAARRFEPTLDASKAAARVARWREAVERARGWARDAAPSWGDQGGSADGEAVVLPSPS